MAMALFGCGGGSPSGAKSADGGTAAGGSSSGAGSGTIVKNDTGGSSGSAAQGDDAGSPSGGMDAAGGMTMTKPPEPTVSDCNKLGAPGVFEEITPPEVKAGIGQKNGGQTQGGTFAMAVDPINQGTVYAGTLFQGVWKTTDCGSTWKHIASGTHAPDVNNAMNWTFAIDPQDPKVVYTNAGYGTMGSNGLFKSTDGGVNWVDIWSKDSQPELGKSFQYNFANVVAIDPTDHKHMLLTFHEPCLAPHPSTCIAETHDAGSTWKLLDGETEWNGNEGQVIWFLDTGSRWVWGSQTNGFWMSNDSGKTWNRIMGMETSHKQGSQIVQAADGKFYGAAADGVWSSPDGNADSWKLIPNTGPIVGGVVTDGTSLFASTGYFDGFGPTKYLRSAVSDGQTWEVMQSPTIQHGGTLGYDPGHKLLYSSNLDSGMWRVVVE